MNNQPPSETDIYIYQPMQQELNGLPNQNTELTVQCFRLILIVYLPSDPFSVQYQRHDMIMDTSKGRTDPRTAQERIVVSHL